MKTALELSGAAWSASLQRYVLVSDDVVEEGAKHIPELFTMTADGALDATPIRIEGETALNDLESITPGPNDTFFVATSHSANKKGHVPESRRQLLHIAIAGQTARVLGHVDLTTVLSANTLDVEGLAFREGALYIGLKAPLTADGRATIYVLPDAAHAVDANALPPLAIHAQPRLCVPACEGISDLAILPDGTMLIAANSPKGMPSDGGGALWKLANANAEPQLVRRFTELKPEGVAVGPDPGSALVVFDRDGLQPLTMTWRLSP